MSEEITSQIKKTEAKLASAQAPEVISYLQAKLEVLKGLQKPITLHVAQESSCQSCE